MPKSNSLLQAWLIHIILHASHLLCFYALSWGEEGLASSVVLCTCCGRQREERILGRSSHLGIGFCRCTVTGFSFKLCPVPQHGSCIHRHFGVDFLVSPKWSCLFFLVSGQLIWWFGYLIGEEGESDELICMITSVLTIRRSGRWESFLMRGLHRVA